MVGEEAADQRPGDTGNPEHSAEVALVAATVARRDDVGDDGLRADHEPAAADPL